MIEQKPTSSIRHNILLAGRSALAGGVALSLTFITIDQVRSAGVPTIEVVNQPASECLRPAVRLSVGVIPASVMPAVDVINNPASDCLRPAVRLSIP